MITLSRQMGVRLGSVRQTLGRTQAEFAESIGISRGYLSKIEAGVTKISVEAIIGLAQAYPNISLRWLVTGDGVMDVPIDTGTNVGSELAELRLMARRGSQSTSRQVLACLRERRAPATAHVLGELLGLDPVDVAADLAVLRRSGLVQAVEGGFLAGGYELRATSPADSGQQCLEVVDAIVRQILPAAEKDDGSGRLIYAAVDTFNAKEFIQVVRTAVRGQVEACPDGAERVTIVLGLSVTG